MKKNITEYIKVISEKNEELLDEIVKNKYSKFLEMYWLLKEYSDNIASLKYKETKNDTLKVEVKFGGGLTPKGVEKDIKSKLKKRNKKFISLKSDSKLLQIIVTMEG